MADNTTGRPAVAGRTDGAGGGSPVSPPPAPAPPPYVVEVLRKARALLDGGRWVQHRERNYDFDSGKWCYCLSGALKHAVWGAVAWNAHAQGHAKAWEFETAAGLTAVYRYVYDRLPATFRSRYDPLVVAAGGAMRIAIEDWNDRPERRYEAVIRFVDRCIADAEGGAKATRRRRGKRSRA